MWKSLLNYANVILRRIKYIFFFAVTWDVLSITVWRNVIEAKIYIAIKLSREFHSNTSIFFLSYYKKSLFNPQH